MNAEIKDDMKMDTLTFHVKPLSEHLTVILKVRLKYLNTLKYEFNKARSIKSPEVLKK